MDDNSATANCVIGRVIQNWRFELQCKESYVPHEVVVLVAVSAPHSGQGRRHNLLLARCHKTGSNVYSTYRENMYVLMVVSRCTESLTRFLL